ncbi:MAG: pyridoxamine 5'-phosphate oxidase family protein, partial [Pseudonocardiaceae bacterium]
PPGFVVPLDQRTVIYPEYRGNGVMASLGNILENPYIGLIFVDFFQAGVGLHINGRARIIDDSAVQAFEPMLARMAGVDQLHNPGADRRKTPQRWVLVDITEAYIHCSRQIPLLARLPGELSRAPASGDHFHAKSEPSLPTPEPSRPRGSHDPFQTPDSQLARAGDRWDGERPPAAEVDPSETTPQSGIPNAHDAAQLVIPPAWQPAPSGQPPVHRGW